jgi:hypothetical protein
MTDGFTVEFVPDGAQRERTRAESELFTTSLGIEQRLAR